MATEPEPYRNRPPQLKDFSEIGFVVNAYMLGCRPPMTLIIETSKEPLFDLAALLFLPDTIDILQEIFDPNRGRRRNPGRHGRKKKGSGGFPDVSALMGNRLRALANPINALNIAPFRYAFKILNVYEGITFTIAIVEGVVDVAFEGLWGAFQLDNNICGEFARLSRYRDEPQTMGGGGDPFTIGNLNQKDFNVGFLETPYAADLASGPFVCTYQATVSAYTPTSDSRGRLVLFSSTDGIIAASDTVTLSGSDQATLTVSATHRPGDALGWGWYAETGFVTVTNQVALAWEAGQIAWW